MADIKALRTKLASRVSEATSSFTQLLDEAYSQGFNDGLAAGKQETGDQLLKFIASMNTDHIPAIIRNEPPSSDEGERVPPGTVKPTVLQTIQQFPDGISIRDIEKLTGFKHNSIRGTVWLLQKEGSVQKGEGNLWIPSPHPEVDDLLGESSKPDASDMFN
jgi:hypothetical protein